MDTKEKGERERGKDIKSKKEMKANSRVRKLYNWAQEMGKQQIRKEKQWVKFVEKPAIKWKECKWKWLANELFFFEFPWHTLSLADELEKRRVDGATVE